MTSLRECCRLTVLRRRWDPQCDFIGVFANKCTNVTYQMTTFDGSGSALCRHTPNSFPGRGKGEEMATDRVFRPYNRWSMMVVLYDSKTGDM
jgi:hypothetical protein